MICLLGAIAGIKGADAAYAPKHLEGTTFMGMLVAILGLGANEHGLIGGYTGYTYPLKDGYLQRNAAAGVACWLWRSRQSCLPPFPMPR